MKKTFTIFAFFLLVSLSLSAQSQDKGGYFVTETNPQEKATIVRIYGNDNALLYEERLEGRRLNTKRKRDMKVLNATLTNVLKQTQLAKKGMQEGKLVAMIAGL